MKNKELKIMTDNQKKTKRNYIHRMNDDKIECMLAKKYGKNYWDGPRKYGYGGYKFIPGRWTNIANNIIKKFKLNNNSKFLMGCGKAFLLYEIKNILPNIEISGFDISRHAIRNSPNKIRKYLFVHKAQNKYPSKKINLTLL